MSLVYKAKSVEDSTYLYLLHAFIAPFFLCRAFIVKNNTKYTVGFSSANDISNGWEGFLPDFADNERRSYFLLRAGDSMVTYVSFCCPKTELDFLIFERTGEDSKYEKTRRRTVNFNLTFRILPKTIQLFSENLKVQFDPDNNSNCFDETNKYEDRKEKPVEIIEQGEEPAKGFELIGFIESINTYYSEGVLLFLSLFQFFSANGDRGNATLLLLISFAVMLVNATRKDPLVAFREISLVSNKNGKRLCLFEWDGAEDAALYVAPLVFNSISVVILNQALATDTIAILNLVTAGIAFGYLFFAGGVIGCALYKMMMERLIAKMEIFPGIKGMLLCSSVSSLTIFTVWILVAYFAFNPFPGLSYAAGTILLLIIVPVLGLKGILLPYAFENLGLLGGVVWLLTTSCAKIRQFSLYALWNVLVECNEWMRTHRLEFFFIFLFFAGIASIISLAYSFSSVRYTFSDDQAP